MTRRDPRFRQLPASAKVFVVVTIAVATAATALAAARDPLAQGDMALFGAIAALCAVASLFEVSSPGSSSLHPGLVFVFGAAILLPPAALPLLAALCFAPAALRRRVRWYTPAFHASVCVLAGLAVHG